MDKGVSFLNSEVQELRSKERVHLERIKGLEDQIMYQELYNRSENLRFLGVPESMADKEDTKEVTSQLPERELTAAQSKCAGSRPFGRLQRNICHLLHTCQTKLFQVIVHHCKVQIILIKYYHFSYDVVPLITTFLLHTASLHRFSGVLLSSMHAYMHACMHEYIHTCMHACIDAYIHTYIHVHIIFVKAGRFVATFGLVWTCQEPN